MVDYEFRILMLEKETAHLREMKDLHSARMDAHQGSLDTIEGLLRENSCQLVTLTANVNTLAGKVDALVSALLREHPNGKDG